MTKIGGRLWNIATLYNSSGITACCGHTVRRTLIQTTFFHLNSHYTILGLTRSASEREIKSAYLEKSKLYHPDLNPDDETMHINFLRVQEAYNALKNRKPDPPSYGNSNSQERSEDWMKYYYTNTWQDEAARERAKRKKAEKEYERQNDQIGISVMVLSVLAAALYLWGRNSSKEQPVVRKHTTRKRRKRRKIARARRRKNEE